MERIYQQIGNRYYSHASSSFRFAYDVFSFDDIPVFVKSRLYCLGADNGKGSWEKM